MSNNNFNSTWHRKLDIIVTAFVFIIVGVLLIMRNLGIINYSIFHFLISWPMLLIVIGIVQLIKHKIVGGACLVAVGTYFLSFKFPWFAMHDIFTFWPVILILTGLIILFTKLNESDNKKKSFMKGETKNTGSTEDGFINSEVVFGSTRQIVFDPYFKGARINNTFGGTVLDLRRTQLQYDETFIDIDCSFGGIEIFVPTSWNVIVEIEPTLAGYHDKRHRGYDELVDHTHKLIIRGKLSFSGLEIKS